MKKYAKLFMVLFFMWSLLTGCASSHPMEAPASAADPGTMEVHFLDVGQGNSTLITCGGHAMLIDAGDDSKGTAIQNYLKKQKVNTLDYLVLTHPDADHIGGAPVVITKFQIDQVFVSNFEKDNKTYQKLIQALDHKRLSYITPDVGSRYSLGTAAVTFLAPNNEYDNPNDSSIALLVQNGENRFLFTGDAQEEAEGDILENGWDISADVYLAGHHGSRTSTSQEFFEAVNPSCAVISCGEGNAYGHPHAQTLNTFRMNKVKVYRTDEDGTIVATSDGKEITFNVPPSETWKAGEPSGSAAAPIQEQEASPAVDTAPAQTLEMPPANKAAGESQSQDSQDITYVLNTKNMKFHRPTCDSLPTANRQDSTESRETLILQGYAPCQRCDP